VGGEDHAIGVDADALNDQAGRNEGSWVQGAMREAASSDRQSLPRLHQE
jgi:hypothetical protein